MKHLISGSRSSQCSEFSFFLAAAHGWYGISSPSTTPSPAGTPPAAPSARTGGAGSSIGRGSDQPGDAGTRRRGHERQCRPRGMGLNVVIGGVDGLPDSVEIRPAVRGARCPIGCGLTRNWPAPAATPRRRPTTTAPPITAALRPVRMSLISSWLVDGQLSDRGPICARGVRLSDRSRRLTMTIRTASIPSSRPKVTKSQNWPQITSHRARRQRR